MRVSSEWVKPNARNILARRRRSLSPTYRFRNRSLLGAPAFPAHKWATAAKKQTAGKAPLSDFSSWMSDFDPNVHKLEVPGQYDGMSSAPPRVSHHSRVVR